MAAHQGLRAGLVRTFGFFVRELSGVFRQPRLILTLIIAPFAILLVFGLGYRPQPPPFDTLLVLPSEDAGFATEQESFDEAFGDAVEVVGTTSDATAARARLQSGDVDLLIIAPADAIDSLEEGERAQFLVVHSEVDPVIRSSINLLSRLSVDELNRLILSRVVAEAQTQAGSVDEAMAGLGEATDSLIAALEDEDTAAAGSARDTMAEGLDRLETESGTSDALLGQVGESLGTDRTDPIDDLRSSLEATSGDDGLESARQFEEDLAALQTRLDQLRGLDPEVLVRPFGVDVEDVAASPPSPALFYAPAALIILVQHLSITIDSLTLVIERQLG